MALLPSSKDRHAVSAFEENLALVEMAFAADKPNCKKTGKNCPMNNGKECTRDKDCDCGK
jgi:hypothetical protein